MASRTIVQLTDDLDGSEADETVSFALDGQPYEIDLTTEHAEQLRGALGEWVEHARRAASSGRGSGQRSRRRAGGSGETSTIRAWAQEKDYAVSDRGRISAEVLEAYRAAHR